MYLIRRHQIIQAGKYKVRTPAVHANSFHFLDYVDLDCDYSSKLLYALIGLC